MAWLVQKKSGIIHIRFRFRGQEIARSLKTRVERTALATLHRVEETIELVERGRLDVPLDADIGSFLLSDGKISQPKRPPKQIRLRELFDKYTDTLPENSVAPESLRIAEIHMRHIVRILGKKRDLRTLQAEDLQHYVAKRSRERGKGSKTVATGTIKKELATFRTLFRWAKRYQYVTSEFPNEGLKYPVERAKPPFQTWSQIERQIARGGLSDNERQDLWGSLYLDATQLEKLLDFIRDNASYGFLFPMTVFAAHTGARRSELCRSKVADFDFEQAIIHIREKKRQHGRTTFRNVPMSATLTEVMQNWLRTKSEHPLMFPAEHKVSRNRNSNRRDEHDSVSPDEATDHLRQTLLGSRYEPIKGWHVFRHSFISNLCCRGVDQRFIDAFVGHQTEDVRQRYRHLFPNTMQQALATAFA